MREIALIGPGGRLPLDRKTLETLAEVIVGLLDIAEPDPDLEPNGDELDGFAGEDEPLFNNEHPAAHHLGPGCPIADPGEPEVGC